MGRFREKMALRGNSPKPDPRSKCPQCEWPFEGERCPNPECRYKRGDLDKRGEKGETHITRADRALAMMGEIIRSMPPEKRAEYERRKKEQKHQPETRP